MRLLLVMLVASCGFSARAKHDVSDDDAAIEFDAGIDARAIDAATTCVGGWCRRKPITITGQVAGTHANFPLLVRIDSDAELAQYARADGRDIFFAADDGTTRLPFQRVSYATGSLVAWVKMPTLQQSTAFFIYYGNAGAADQQDVANTWTASYAAVWHFDEASGGNNALRDATSNGNHATNLSGAVAGMAGYLGNGVTFDGANDYVQAANSGSLDATATTATFSAWARWTDPSAGRFQFLLVTSNAFTTGAEDGYSWAVQPDGDHYIYPWVGNVNDYNLVTNPFANATWHYVAATFSFATKEAKIYVDGVERALAMNNTATLWTQTAQPADWRLGGTPARTGEYFGGTLDEVRIATTARSANWLLTEFRNQSAALTFISVGPETVLQ